MTGVSVLLTTYNRPRMLCEAIESVLDQTYKDFEIIVLDDNSSDPEQVEVLQRYWCDARIRVYKDNVREEDRRKTARYATLINIGLGLARGKYVTYLCDDDLYLPGRLQVMTERLDKGDCEVVYGTQRMMRDGQITGMREAYRLLENAYHIVDHSSVMHTRAAAEAVGGWDDSRQYWTHADAVFWNRLTGAGYFFHPVPYETDIHRFWSGSVTEAGVS